MDSNQKYLSIEKAIAIVEDYPFILAGGSVNISEVARIIPTVSQI